MTCNSSKLSALTKDLNNKWQDTKDHWRDDKAHEFERQYMEELFNNVDKAVAAAKP